MSIGWRIVTCGICGGPAQQVKEATALPEIPLVEAEPLDKGPNAAAEDIAGRALAAGVVAPPPPLSGTAPKYLSNDEAYRLDKAEKREPKDLATIRDLMGIALEKKKTFEKADENGLSTRLFKDIAPYYTHGCSFTETLTVEQCIRTASVSQLDHILLAACKLRIVELADRNCRRDGYGTAERVISYRDPTSGDYVPLSTLTPEKAFFDLKLYEANLANEIEIARQQLEGSLEVK